MDKTTPPTNTNPLANSFGEGAQDNPDAEREAALKMIGDIDALAANALTGAGLDPRVKFILDQFPGVIDPEAFRRKLGFAMAERAMEMAKDTPEQAASLLNRAVDVLGSRIANPAFSAALSRPSYSRAVLGAFLYASKRSSSQPKKIAEEARKLMDELEEEKREAKEAHNREHHSSQSLTKALLGVANDQDGADEAVDVLVEGFRKAGELSMESPAQLAETSREQLASKLSASRTLDVDASAEQTLAKSPKV